MIVLVILMNSLTLALYDYSDRDSLSAANQSIDKANLAFTGIFIGEAVGKIVAKGFYFHKESYLKNGWNVIDAFVVISG